MISANWKGKLIRGGGSRELRAKGREKKRPFTQQLNNFSSVTARREKKDSGVRGNRKRKLRKRYILPDLYFGQVQKTETPGKKVLLKRTGSQIRNTVHTYEGPPKRLFQ